VSVAGHPAATRGDILENLRGVPFYILHGDKDEKISVVPVRRASAELTRRKIDHVYVEAKGAGHTPPMKYWGAANEWIARQAPKSFSPRPLFLPPVGGRALYRAIADPLGVNEPDNAAVAKIRAGQAREATLAMHRRIRQAPRDARAYVSRALSYVPGLLKAYPYTLRPSDFADRADGWTVRTENAALTDLFRATRVAEGKGPLPKAFDAAARLLRARILAKQFAVTVDRGGIAWVRPYNSAVRELQAVLRLQPGSGGAVALIRALQKRLPANLPRRPAPRR
jgi:hypothetical protein